MGQNKTINKKIILSTLMTILFINLISIACANTVPKSETIVIPGQLNDTLDDSQYFNMQVEYTYGDNSIQTTQKNELIEGDQAKTTSTLVSYRKTYLQKQVLKMQWTPMQ
jgi:hypothetical protein